MSRISDALREARKEPPGQVPRAVPPPPPTTPETLGLPWWFLPGLAAALLLAAVLLLGWAMFNHPSHQVATRPPNAAMPAAHREVAASPKATAPPPTAPPANPEPMPSAPPEAPMPASPPDMQPLPKLQGIFYSPSAPSAIMDGKSVKPGDRIHGYEVKAIGQQEVTLIGADRKEILLHLGN